ncbi:energy-coupling factor ABC transporter permease [Halomonas halocynthiae]|uniref:energy-coupling factor ABC transporter permease n=1 Tax=Halomonas halocynthiae TaxID=176290 RepID=UPI0003F7B049|nr:energy-coupling factor ABC transporter permease [Halomonas halocynthiae]
MTFSDPVLAPWLLGLCFAVSAVFLGVALSRRPWRVLLDDNRLQHRWLAATVVVMLMWQLRAQAVDWLTLHLMFTALLTLIFKAPLALITVTLINLAMATIGRSDWSLVGINVFVTGVMPALTISITWRLVDRFLADNLMVFIFICGFFGSALSSLFAGLSAVGLVLIGASDPDVVRNAIEYARFLPLLMPSEAFITGMLLSILVVYHPEWVATFSEHRYIDTK